MALSAGSLSAAIKAAVNAIDVDNGAITNDQVLEALATAIINEITSNALVVVPSGSSAGSYQVT